MSTAVWQPKPSTFTRVFTSYDEPEHEGGLTLCVWPDGAPSPSHVVRLANDSNVLLCCLQMLDVSGWARIIPERGPDFDLVHGIPERLREAIEDATAEAAPTPTLIVVDVSLSLPRFRGRVDYAAAAALRAAVS